MKSKNNTDKTNKKNKNTQRLAVFVGVIVLILLLTNIGITYAKYIQRISNNTALVAKPFYLASDTIKDSYTKLERDSDDSVALKIDFRNYIDDLRVNDESFNYSFKLELMKKDVLQEVIDEFTGSFTAGEKEEIKKEYTVNGVRDDMSIKATVTTLDSEDLVGYGKSITQDFGFSESISKITYEVTEHGRDSNIVMMYVGGALDKDPITVIWPDNFEPNTTGFKIISSSKGEMVIEAQLGAIYQIEFYKTELDTPADLSKFSAY